MAKLSLDQAIRSDNSNDLDEKLRVASKKAALETIDFVKAKFQKQPVPVTGKLNKQFILLEPPGMFSNGINCKEKNSPIRPEDLFPDARLALRWNSTMSKMGGGLHNSGNTCFLNSVLQCMVYTAPLYNALCDHISSCHQKWFCVNCELRRTMERVIASGKNGGGGDAIRPQAILQNLKRIAKTFKLGHQEDAHEFLVYLLDACQRACLRTYSNGVEKHLQYTTMVYKIFGGKCRTQVICQSCRQESNTFDPFLTISIDVRDVQSVESALKHYVALEILRGENKYRCEKCQRQVEASRRVTFHKLPKVLILHLKRFYFSSFMNSGKISRHVTFPSKLDMSSFCSGKLKNTQFTKYKLYAVLVHAGFSCKSGHYFAFVKSPAGQWFQCNDSHVSLAHWSKVQEQQAYMLFYIIDPDVNGITYNPLQNIDKRAENMSSTKIIKTEQKPIIVGNNAKMAPQSKEKQQNGSIKCGLVYPKTSNVMSTSDSLVSNKTNLSLLNIENTVVKEKTHASEVSKNAGLIKNENQPVKDKALASEILKTPSLFKSESNSINDKKPSNDVPQLSSMSKNGNITIKTKSVSSDSITPPNSFTYSFNDTLVCNSNQESSKSISFSENQNSKVAPNKIVYNHKQDCANSRKRSDLENEWRDVIPAKRTCQSNGSSSPTNSSSNSSQPRKISLFKNQIRRLQERKRHLKQRECYSSGEESEKGAPAVKSKQIPSMLIKERLLAPQRISSWDGTEHVIRNHTETRVSFNKRSYDELDYDIDRGRVRSTKASSKHKSSHYNMFQECYEKRILKR